MKGFFCFVSESEVFFLQNFFVTSICEAKRTYRVYEVDAVEGYYAMKLLIKVRKSCGTERWEWQFGENF